jgi:hypothetical protein
MPVFVPPAAARKHAQSKCRTPFTEQMSWARR